MVSFAPGVDPDTFAALPKSRALPTDAPECPCCGRRMKAITSCRRFTRYYPVRCGCRGVHGIKRRRKIDWTQIDQTTRLHLGRSA